jgi:RNA exonuclease 1
MPQPLPTKRLVESVSYMSSRDMKRKYTETFNLAAKEFVPSTAKPPAPKTATLITDPAVDPSINFNVRQVPLNMLHKAYKELYNKLPDGPDLAARDAALEEVYIAKTSHNVQTYQVSWKQVYARLKKRPAPTSVKGACTLYELEARRVERERRLRWEQPLTPAELAPLIPSRDELARWGYITRYPRPEAFNPREMAMCHRCTTMFTPQTRTQYPCISHWGKLVGTSDSADGKVWSCCHAPVGARGCTNHPCHVRKVDNPGQLAAIRPFIALDEYVEGQHLPVVSLDCEMAYTTMGMELVRVTVLDDNDRLVFDLLVRPEGEIYDFNTRFSGITLQKFESQVTVSFDEAREMLRHYVSADTVIIGHGLENDLVALRILHFALVDTALVFPHPRGRPYRLGLKDLMVRECGLEIQTAGEEGHDSVEDAGAASLLVRKRIRGDAFPGPFTK